MLRKGRNLWEEVGVGTGGSEMKWRIEENQRNLRIIQLYVVICWCCFEIIHTTIVYSYYMLWYVVTVVITCCLSAIIRNRSVPLSSSDESWKWMEMDGNESKYVRVRGKNLQLQHVVQFSQLWKASRQEQHDWCCSNVGWQVHHVDGEGSSAKKVGRAPLQDVNFNADFQQMELYAMLGVFGDAYFFWDPCTY